jgi:GDP-L-fucose synthase
MTNIYAVRLAFGSIKPDIIINLAANVGSIEYVAKNSAHIVHENMQMYLNLYKAASEVCPNVQIINTLANCSYPSKVDIQNETNWWDGMVHPSVMSFGNAKRMLWVLGECYKKQHGIKSLSLIMPNAYGVLDHTDIDRVHAMNGIIIRMIKAKRNGDKTFSIWGTGSPIREWVYMPDVAKVITACLDKEFDETYFNIGQESGISIAESAKIIAKSMDYNVELVFDTSKPDGAPIKILGKSVFRKHFPDFQFTTYEQGIKDTIEYYEKAL